MNQKAKHELTEVICGLVMVATGVFLFITKARIDSDFLNVSGKWTIWKVILVFLPLLAGIVMMIVKPQLRISKIISACGVLAVLIVLFVDMTIIVKPGVEPIEWISGFLLAAAGVVVCMIALFLNKKNKQS